MKSRKFGVKGIKNVIFKCSVKKFSLKMCSDKFSLKHAMTQDLLSRTEATRVHLEQQVLSENE